MSFGFIGEYYHSVDVKGRMNIPVKFRELLGDSFVVTRGLDKCLSIYPTEAFQAFAQKLQSLPISDKNARQFVRFFLSGAVECELDKQGRILLPQSLRMYADISKDVVVTGNGSTIEIWDSNQWNDYNNTIDPDAIADSMVELGI
ncbi:MAG: division/cell wall cluster transcriptional repressor MraZ [Ruminococcaceae bacterium]|nr:division/cell wall cluster transcriptional repressor MraZ [Oscillospiraceae bacterium]